MIGVVGFVCAMAGGPKARPATMPAATPSLSLKWEKVVPSEVAEPLIWLSRKGRVICCSARETELPLAPHGERVLARGFGLPVTHHVTLRFP